jgi:signal transduction histidine kinase
LGQELRLSLEGDHLSLVVLDRGPGFGKLPLEMGDDQMRLGLAGLCDRVESLGGRVVIANRTDGPGAELRMELELNGDI